MLRINEMQAVRGYRGIFRRRFRKNSYYISRRYNCFKRDYERCVYMFCGGIYWPPNHAGSVALLKRKNTRIGFEKALTS